MEETTEDKVSKWSELKDFFLVRLSSPLEHPEYILYFLAIVIGAGGIGIWVGIAERFDIGEAHDTLIIQSISAFSVAVIATGSIELFFVKNKYIKTTLFIISFCFIALSIVSYLISTKMSGSNGYYLAVPTCILALLVWWIANADNSNLTENFFRRQSEESKKLNESLNEYDG
ncbi:hypothetical protein [Aquimarina algiphila]|uniref:hypothetical protein n=1 Tax=Aquimarina algiphila TaxID=2047982 RepID=UPI002492B1F4|nr:hypothetical protein [Aquimarina algiphila]